MAVGRHLKGTGKTYADSGAGKRLADSLAGSSSLEWIEQLPLSVMVCDRKYVTLYMNDRAAEDHAEDGGRALVGKDLMACHPPEAQLKLREVLASGRPNVYITERKGKRKLVCQCQWKKRGRVGGVVQLVIELPKDVPLHKR